ncbi:hypothetical protein SLE2022_153660 [Rubroshorea leprosula]
MMNEGSACKKSARGVNLHLGTNLSELIKTEGGIKVITDHKSWWQMQCSLPLKTVFGGRPSKPDYGNISCSVFSIPPLSTVGLSEEQAEELANSDILVFASSFNPIKNTVTGQQEKTIMKSVVDAEMDKVLGAPMCGQCI